LRRKLLWRMGYRELESRSKRLDPFEAQASLLSGRRVDAIFDVGANVGQTARRYRRWFPDSRIWSFEPFPGAMAELRAAHGGDPRVEKRSEAVADRAGTRTFHVNRFNYNHSLLGAAPGSAQWARIDHVGAIEVPVTTVDAFCAEHSIPEIQILKTDTEGGDLMVLRGAAGMLAAHRIALVYTEALFVPIFEGQPGFHDLAAFLHGHGYRLFDFFDQSYAESGQLTLANALFVGPQLTARRGPGGG
jgi:FkbM family methyltransferase